MSHAGSKRPMLRLSSCLHKISERSAPGEILCSLIVMEQPIRGGVLRFEMRLLQCCGVVLCCDATAIPLLQLSP